MPTPSEPDRRRSAADNPLEPQLSAANRETKRPTDSIPMQSGKFSSLPMRFGRYEIKQLLGKGGMGSVYLAVDTDLERRVALKIPKVSSSGSKKLLQRLQTEARAAAKIDHPAVCKVYDYGEIDGVCFIVMQYVEGESLQESRQGS